MQSVNSSRNEDSYFIHIQRHPLARFLYFAKGLIGVNKIVPNKCYEAPVIAISILHQETEIISNFGSWKETSNRNKKKMRKNKAYHFLEVNTNTFPPTKQTNKQ